MIGEGTGLHVGVVQLPERHTSAGANFAMASRVLGQAAPSPGTTWLVVLPELIGADAGARSYEGLVSQCARNLGAWVVGGSHHLRAGSQVVNRGVVARPDGSLAAEYEKANPYGVELSEGVSAGAGGVVVDVEGWDVYTVVCADFFYSAAFSGVCPHLVAVPALSLTRGRRHGRARRVWRHAALARSYELGSFIAISDWSRAVPYGADHSSGVAAVVSPAGAHGPVFQGLKRRTATTAVLGRAVVDRIRRDRAERAFLVPVPRL